MNGKYLGVLNWGTITREEILKDNAKVQRFLVDESGGTEREALFALRQDADFTLLNKLICGYEYLITVEDDVVTDAELAEEIPSYKPLISLKGSAFLDGID